MRQRNISGYPLAVRPSDADPFEVGPGEVVDWPELLAGCTPEEDPEPEAPARRRKTAPAAAGDTEEDRP